MSDKPKVVAWGSFYKGTMQDFGYNEKATMEMTMLDFHGRKLDVYPLIRLSYHESARAAENARIEELERDVARYRWLREFIDQSPQAIEHLACSDGDLLDEVIDAALAHQGKAAEKRNPNSGHGHVYPRPDRVLMRCGGPGICSECSRDKAQQGKGGVK